MKKNQISDFITKNPSLKSMLNKLPKIARSDSAVLILGESGTGKELIAKAIHKLSDRCSKSFVAINCAAIPDELIESELFGYVKGAFTGATANKKGKFELADGGTIFLDEIGDMPLKAQAKLLRVLQEKEIEPIGSTKKVKVDVRIISATNKDLEKLINEGKFREDLFYRLNVIVLQLLPLRKRKEDIPLLVQNFIKKFSELKGVNVKGVSQKAMQLLIDYTWPGNVRELENVIESAVVLCENEIITEEDLPPRLTKNFILPNNERKALYQITSDLNELFTSSNKNDEFVSVSPFVKLRFPEKPFFLDDELSNIERFFVKEALNKCKGNQTKTAQYLGVKRTTLIQRLKKLGLL